MRTPRWLLLMCLSTACESAPELRPNTVLVTVGDEQLTVAHFARDVLLLYEQAQRGEAAPTRPERYHEFLERRITLEVLAKEAVRRKIDTSPIARRRMREAMVDVYLDDVLARLAAGRKLGARGWRKLRAQAVRALLQRLRQDPEIVANRFTNFGLELEDEDRELLAREGERLGFFERPSTAVRTKQILASLVLRSDVDAGVVVLHDVTDAEVRNAYDASFDRFHRPSSVDVWVAAFDDPVVAAELEFELRSVGAADMPGHSDLLGDYRSGPGLVSDLKVTDSRLPAAIVETLHRLDPIGAIAGPIADGGAFYVVRLLARAPSMDVALEEASPTIRGELKRAAFLDVARTRAESLADRWPITRNIEALERFAALQLETNREH